MSTNAAQAAGESGGDAPDARQLRTILTTVSIALMAVIASVSGLIVAQTHMAVDFDTSQGTVLWIINVYTLVLAALLLPLGAIGDRLGRRPMLIAGLAVFMTAHGVAALVVARALHGAAVGTTVVVGSAALLDLRPEHGARSGHLTGIMFNVGMAVTILSASLLAQYAPDPLVTPYAVAGM